MLMPMTAHAVPGTTSVDVDGNEFEISYDAEGLEILDVISDLDTPSLIFEVDVTGSPGIFEITFERNFFDSLFDGTDVVETAETHINLASVQEYAQSSEDSRVAMVVTKYLAATSDEEIAEEMGAGNDAVGEIKLH